MLELLLAAQRFFNGNRTRALRPGRGAKPARSPLKRVLTSRPYSIAVATSGHAAMECVATNGCDVAFHNTVLAANHCDGIQIDQRGTSASSGAVPAAGVQDGGAPLHNADRPAGTQSITVSVTPAPPRE